MTRLASWLTSHVNRRMDSWLTTRFPANKQQQLNASNIFVFPTRFGFWLLGFIVLLFLMGTNYQNNLILLLSYLLTSLFILSIFHSYQNLAGLTFNTIVEQQGEVGGQMPVAVVIRGHHHHQQIRCYFANQPITEVDSVFANQSQSVHVTFALHKRGLIKPPRLIVESYFALGLIRTWSRIDFGWQLLAVPKPIICTWPQQQAEQHSKENSHGQLIKGQEEFYQLKAYQTGEPLTHVAWKQLAKGQGKLLKDYRAQQSDTVWLSLQQVPLPSTEQRLAGLVYWVYYCHRQQQPFGLELGNYQLEPDQGEKHLKQCLRAIACYGH